MTEGSSSWEKAYQRRHSGEIEPDPSVTDAVSVFRANNVRDILDLGCGDGRHLVFLGKLGYRMFGLDYAPTALVRAKDWVAREGISAELKCEDFSQLPWPGVYFDAVVCIKTINHGKIESIRNAFHEITRVLRSGGLLIATLPKHPPRRHWKNGNIKEIEPRTYIPLEGHEEGVSHHFFTEKEIMGLLGAYEIFCLRDDSPERPRYVVVARKQAGNGQ